MALFKTAIEQVTGRGYHMFGTIGDKLMNTTGMLQLEDNDDTQSAFLYRMNLQDDQEGITRVESEDSVATLVAYDAVPIINSFLILGVYPEANATSTPENRRMPASNIILAYDFDGGAILYLKEGARSERYLVSQTIDEILSKANTTTTSSTTTSSTTTPTTTTTTTSSTTTVGDFRATSGAATAASVRVQTTESPLNGSLVIGEFTVKQDAAPLVITSFSSGPTYFDVFVDGLLSGTTLTATYPGITAESTFGTDLDLFTDLPITNNVPVSDTILWDDGVDFFRLQVRDGELNLDQVIGGTGFAGVEGVDWDVIWSKSLP